MASFFCNMLGMGFSSTIENVFAFYMKYEILTGVTVCLLTISKILNLVVSPSLHRQECRGVLLF